MNKYIPAAVLVVVCLLYDRFMAQLIYAFTNHDLGQVLHFSVVGTLIFYLFFAIFVVMPNFVVIVFSFDIVRDRPT